MTNFKIRIGKNGFHLSVNGYYVHFLGGEIKLIKSVIGVPYGASEWVSIPALRSFWRTHKKATVSAKKFDSIWGNFVLINEAK